MEIRLAKIVSLDLSEGKVYGARYHTVEPNFGAGPGWFEAEWNYMVEWCVKTYGPTPLDGVFVPGGRWYTNNAKFWFRTEADRDFFILRWQ
jgi:hypothetical protein